MAMFCQVIILLFSFYTFLMARYKRTQYKAYNIFIN